MKDGQTPAGTVVKAQAPDGVEHDVTTAVQALYDLAVGSLDFGSGFWSVEETEPVAALAKLCGFGDIDWYVNDRRKREEHHRNV